MMRLTPMSHGPPKTKTRRDLPPSSSFGAGHGTERRCFRQGCSMPLPSQIPMGRKLVNGLVSLCLGTKALKHACLISFSRRVIWRCQISAPSQLCARSHRMAQKGLRFQRCLLPNAAPLERRDTWRESAGGQFSRP